MAPVTVSVQGPGPVQPPPLHPPKTLPAAGLAVSVTTLPLARLWLQSPPQSIPGPETLPVPAPSRSTTSTTDGGLLVAAVAQASGAYPDMPFALYAPTR